MKNTETLVIKDSSVWDYDKSRFEISIETDTTITKKELVHLLTNDWIIGCDIIGLESHFVIDDNSLVGEHTKERIEFLLDILDDDEYGATLTDFFPVTKDENIVFPELGQSLLSLMITDHRLETLLGDKHVMYMFDKLKQAHIQRIIDGTDISLGEQVNIFQQFPSEITQVFLQRPLLINIIKTPKIQEGKILLDYEQYKFEYRF